MPTKTKHMARKASMSDTAPLSKQIKKESVEKSGAEMAVILDTVKVTEATKNLERIPKKARVVQELKSEQEESELQVIKGRCENYKQKN